MRAMTMAPVYIVLSLAMLGCAVAEPSDATEIRVDLVPDPEAPGLYLPDAYESVRVTFAPDSEGASSAGRALSRAGTFTMCGQEYRITLFLGTATEPPACEIHLDSSHSVRLDGKIRKAPNPEWVGPNGEREFAEIVGSLALAVDDAETKVTVSIWGFGPVGKIDSLTVRLVPLRGMLPVARRQYPITVVPRSASLEVPFTVNNLMVVLDRDGDGLLEGYARSGEYFEGTGEIRLPEGTLRLHNVEGSGKWCSFSIRPPSGAPEPMLAVGGLAPEFAGKTLDGATLTLESLRGRPVLVVFWASWCAPCRDELPRLVNRHTALARRGIQVVGVSLDDNVSAAQECAKSLGLPWPNIVQRNSLLGSIARRYHIERIPDSVLIDSGGRIQAKHALVTVPDLLAE